MLLSEFYKV